jgi:hypothetical protein
VVVWTCIGMRLWESGLRRSPRNPQAAAQARRGNSEHLLRLFLCIGPGLQQTFGEEGREQDRGLLSLNPLPGLRGIRCST